MRAVFNVPITKPGGGIKFVSKETEINFVPVTGMLVEDLAWKSPVKVIAVCYGIDTENLTVSLEDHKSANLKDQDSLLEMYKNYGWKVVGE